MLTPKLFFEKSYMLKKINLIFMLYLSIQKTSVHKKNTKLIFSKNKFNMKILN